MRKKRIYIKSYMRSRHGRAKFGGKVSEHFRSIKPMLAKRGTSTEPKEKKGWIWEHKMDGTRALAYIDRGKVELMNRRGVDITGRYPELQDMGKTVKGEAILDGEIIVRNKKGADDFRLLSKRDRLQNKEEIKKRSKTLPSQFIAFDILERNKHWLVNEPLKERKEVLKSTITKEDSVQRIKSYKNPKELWHKVKRNQWEGVVGKNLDSTYKLDKRSPDWQKIKLSHNIDALALGYTEPEGKRKGTFGSLILGAYDNGKLKYIGKVGTGFEDKELKKLKRVLSKYETKKRPSFVGGDYFGPRKVHWLKPKTIHRIKFNEWTKDKRMRTPVWMGIRKDITPKGATI